MLKSIRRPCPQGNMPLSHSFTGSVTGMLLVFGLWFTPTVPALKAASAGSIVAWGLNDKGQTLVPAGLNGVTAIAAGAYHGVALKSDGTLVAWGDNINGETNIPAGLSGVIAISPLAAVKSEVAPKNWTGGIVKNRPQKKERSVCPKNDVSTVPS